MQAFGVYLVVIFLYAFSFVLFYGLHGLQDLGILQGTAVRVELGDATTAADPTGAHTISRSFPHTYGQPLAHFLRATAKVPEAQIITEHPAIRYLSNNLFCGFYLSVILPNITYLRAQFFFTLMGWGIFLFHFCNLTSFGL